MAGVLHKDPYSDRFGEALSYAAATHRTQMRKGTDNPYVGHLLGVASIVIDAGGSEDEAIAAVLHDAPEDQGGQPRLDDIAMRFGERVASIVSGCSDSLAEDAESKSPWIDRKAAYIRHLRACKDKSVYLVSVADKLHNARATLLDHRHSGDEIWKRFKAGRDAQLEKYRTLIAVYEDGPEDARRGPVLADLKRTIDELANRKADQTPP